MSLQEEIAKALGAHGVWKMRLKTAIDTGKADAQAGDVAKDNVCAFGQWLYGASLAPDVKAGPDYQTVRKLHADFHKCAASVIECVGHGDKAKASALMEGEYTKVSSALSAAMMKWKASVH